jgi:hypothetical protein
LGFAPPPALGPLAVVPIEGTALYREDGDSSPDGSE